MILNEFKCVGVIPVSMKITIIFVGFFTVRMWIMSDDRIIQNHICVKAPLTTTNPYTISLTSLRPKNMNISLLNFVEHPVFLSNKAEIILNVNQSMIIEGFRVNVVVDDGPLTKVSGLCGIIDSVKTDVIIYLDDDITYDLTHLDYLANHVSRGVVMGREGGFYQGKSLIHLRYLEETFGLKPCYTSSQVIMGYGAVGINKEDLRRVCHKLINPIPMTLKYIDDELLSKIYHDLGFEIISSRKFITYLDLSKSQDNQHSRRKDYSKYRDLLMSYFN